MINIQGNYIRAFGFRVYGIWDIFIRVPISYMAVRAFNSGSIGNG